MSIGPKQIKISQYIISKCDRQKKADGKGDEAEEG